MQDKTDNNYKNRDLLDVVIQKKEEQQIQEAGTRISNLIPRDDGNLSRPSSFMSKQSITFSQSNDRLSEDVNSMLQDKKIVNNITLRIYTLAIICMTSLIICALTLQLLYALGDCQNLDININGTLITSSKTYADVIEVATAFSTFCLVLNVNCILVCSMQCFVTAKILKVENGEERSIKYLTECSSSRFIAVVGFFASLPLFLLCKYNVKVFKLSFCTTNAAIMLYIVLRYKTTPAVTSIIIISIGFIFCILSVMQNTYQWRAELVAAEEGRPVYDSKSNKTSAKLGHENKLSTLV
ncbi:hypothetical protein KUTeg_018343 [Tegillarca granosa]|uniref:Transmembrane protein n=1 Tax=Tegillarca granosa TaxID=220873 RepID=A0ABQ9EHV6_TEGGR|nr:hypothetical protein KUTeg_018343 [Tegillarca granosa]